MPRRAIRSTPLATAYILAAVTSQTVCHSARPIWPRVRSGGLVKLLQMLDERAPVFLVYADGSESLLMDLAISYSSAEYSALEQDYHRATRCIPPGEMQDDTVL
jgi:hypothetical protein